MPTISHRGFTLIELAVVVAIIGFISVGFVKLAQTLQEKTAESATTVTLNEASKALRRFITQTGRLPCPADPTLPPANALYGTEALVAGDCDGTVVTVIDPGATGTPQSFLGTLPFITLGLSGDLRFDGREHQITYAVHANAILADALTAQVWNPILAVTDIAGNPVRPPAVLLMLAHGANGFGATTVDGAALQAPPATALSELENLDGDEIFVDTDFSEDAATPYDDIVVSFTERELLQPLYETGAISDRAAPTRERVRRVVDAAIAITAADLVDPDPLPQNPLYCDCSITNAPTVAFCADPANAQHPTCALLCQPLDPGEAPQALDGCTRSVRHRLLFADADADGVEDAVAAGDVPWLSLGLSAQDRTDSWGNPLNYSVNLQTASVGPDSTFGIYTGPGAFIGYVLRVYSTGPDGVADPGNVGAPGPCSAAQDDVCVALTAQELIARFASSGIPVD